MQCKYPISLLAMLLLVSIATKAQIKAISNSAGTIQTTVVATGTNWTNASEVGANDGVAASCVITGASKPSYNLDLKGWGFQSSDNTAPNFIPPGAIINGVEVYVKMKKQGAGTIKDGKIMLMKNGGETGVTRARGGTQWPSEYQTVRFGSNTDLWGATWAASDLIKPNFGVRIVARNRGVNDAEALIDYVSIRVYFNQVFFFSKSTGDISLLSTWGKNRDGSGVEPTDFSSDGQIFCLRNRRDITSTVPFTITGDYSKMVVGDSLNITNLTIPDGNPIQATMDVFPRATVTITDAISPQFDVLSDNTTITYNNTDVQYVASASYFNVVIAGVGRKFLMGNLQVSGLLSVNDKNTVYNEGYNVTVTAPSSGITNNGLITGTGHTIYSVIDQSASIVGTGTFSNLSIQAESTSSSVYSISLANTTTITDTLKLSNGSFINGTFLNMPAASVIYVADGTLASPITASGYDIIYKGFTGGSKITSNEISGSPRNVTVEGDMGILSMNRNMSLTGNLNIISGTLDPSAANYTITLAGDLTNNGTLVTRSQPITFNGNSKQRMLSNITQSVFKLVVNNANGLDLESPLNITGELRLTNGIVNTNSSHGITVLPGAAIIGGNSSSYVNGPLKVQYNSTSATTRVFPVGKDGAYRPVQLTVTLKSNAVTTFTAEVISGKATTRNIPLGISYISITRHWNVSNNNAANIGSAVIKLEYGADDGVYDATHLRILKSSGENWINLGGTGTGVSNGTITSSTFYNFSDFVLAYSNNVFGVLPMSFVSFDGENKNNNVDLKWQTANETNTDHFAIERSLNGSSWSTIGRVKPGTATDNSYMYTDTEPFANGYYRIRQFSVDGKITYSSMIQVRSNRQNAVTTYPNPFRGTTFTVKVQDEALLGSNAIDVTIVDAAGRIVYATKTQPRVLININCGPLPKGRYMVIVQNGENKHHSGMMVQ